MVFSHISYSVMLMKSQEDRVLNIGRLVEQHKQFNIYPSLNWKCDWDKVVETLKQFDVRFNNAVISRGHVALWATLLQTMQEIEKIDCQYHVLLEDDAIIEENFEERLKEFYLDTGVIDGDTMASRLGIYTTGVVYRQGYLQQLLDLIHEVGIDRGVDHFQANIACDTYTHKLPIRLMLMPKEKIIKNIITKSMINTSPQIQINGMLENDLDWVATIRQEISISSLFRYAPARGKPYGLTFKAGGKIGLNAGRDFSTWEVGFNSSVCLPVLKLSGKNEILQLTLDTGGQWCGTDSKRGHVRVSCISSRRDRWKDLVSQRRFFSSKTIDADEPTFKYLEPLADANEWPDYKINKEIKGMWLPKAKVAVAIIAYNRSDYFKQSVQALARNKRIHELPIFVFIDHASEYSDKIQHDIVKEYLPACVVIQRPVNYGCGRNIIDARRQLFDNLGYDRVFVFEDDMVVSSNYLEFCEHLFDWAEEHYDDVGAVQGWNLCVMGSKQKLAKCADVQGTFANWWGYLMSKRAWNSMSPLLYKYEKLFLGSVYGKRPHRSIIDWFARKDRWRYDRGFKKFPVNSLWESSRDAHFRQPATGQDAATEHLFHRAGWIRLAPVVNHGLYIGRQGIHMKSGQFERDGFGTMQLEECEIPSEFLVSETIPKIDTLLGFRHIEA